jgi:hypothetical protein
MESLLRKLYNDPRTGFVSANKLYQKAKELNSSVRLKDVQEWYKTQANIQQYSNQKKKYPQFKIASSNPNEWQMDLAFWTGLTILICVNINSRIGYAKLLKNKQAATVQKAIDQFITDNEVNALMSDNGSEFTNNQVERFFDKNSITHANSIPGDHTVLGKIDRFIRTIKGRLTKMQESLGFKKLTQRYLDDAIHNYNNTYHSSIKSTPNKMKGRVIFDEIEYNKRIVKKVQNGLQSGKIVRYRLTKKTFQKESAIWSKAVYEVMGMDGLKIKIKSANGKILYKSVNDLKIVNSVEVSSEDHQRNDMYEIEKIETHYPQKNGKNKYLIKWKGYAERTIEPQDNLRLVNKNQMSAAEKIYFQRADAQG